MIDRSNIAVKHSRGGGEGNKTASSTAYVFQGKVHSDEGIRPSDVRRLAAKQLKSSFLVSCGRPVAPSEKACRPSLGTNSSSQEKRQPPSIVLAFKAIPS